MRQLPEPHGVAFRVEATYGFYSSTNNNGKHKNVIAGDPGKRRIIFAEPENEETAWIKWP